MSERQLTELRDYLSSDAFDETERLVIEYADAITSTPATVPDALFARIRAAFSDEQITELTSAIAWENYRARFNRALAMEPQNFSEGAFCAVPDYGQRSA